MLDTRARWRRRSPGGSKPEMSGHARQASAPGALSPVADYQAAPCRWRSGSTSKCGSRLTWSNAGRKGPTCSGPGSAGRRSSPIGRVLSDKGRGRARLQRRHEQPGKIRRFLSGPRKPCTRGAREADPRRHGGAATRLPARPPGGRVGGRRVRRPGASSPTRSWRCPKSTVTCACTRSTCWISAPGCWPDDTYKAWGTRPMPRRLAAWREVDERGWPGLARLQARKALAHRGATRALSRAEADLRTFVHIPLASRCPCRRRVDLAAEVPRCRSTA